MSLWIPHLVKIDLIEESFLELPILAHLLMLNIERPISLMQVTTQKILEEYLIFKPNKILNKNQYNNSNDSSNENKSFYDIVKDSPFIKKR